MSDIDVLREMLGRAEIPLNEHEEECGCGDGPHPAFSIERGYQGFFSLFTFDKENGRLLDVEAFE